MVTNNSQERTEKEWNLLIKSIYDEYFKKLCVFANSIINDEEEAEEIVQGIILKLWEQRENYDTIENLTSYLYRSVKNSCINIITHNKIEDKYKSETWFALKAMEIQATEKTPQEEQDEHDKQEANLRNAIELLPERCKEVLTLSKFEGKRNKDIAEELDISVKAVEANITRAFTTLRKILKNN